MGPTSNHKCSCKREAEGELTYRRGGDSVTMWEEIGEMQLQAKECLEASGNWRMQRMDSSLEPPKEYGPGNSLISDF